MTDDLHQQSLQDRKKGVGTMKSFIINAPGSYEVVTDKPMPTITSEEVLVKVHKVGFCGSDLNTFRGANPMVTYPRIPGHEIAGEIVEVGSEVPKTWNLGDKVSVLPYTTCGICWSCLTNRPNACKNNETLGVQRDGGITEYIAVPYAKLIGGVASLSYQEIALVEPLAVGFHASRRAEPKKGETFLVFGCGLVGLGAIIAGSRSEATVIAVDIDDAKLSLAKEFGAIHTINSAKEDLATQVAILTEGHGVTIALEAIGLPATFQAAIDLVSFAGRVVYVGYAKNAVSYETKLFVMKEIQIRGSRNALKIDFEQVLNCLAEKRLPFLKLISEEVSLDQAGKALAKWNTNPGAISKILVDLT